MEAGNIRPSEFRMRNQATPLRPIDLIGTVGRNLPRMKIITIDATLSTTRIMNPRTNVEIIPKTRATIRRITMVRNADLLL